MIRAIHFPRAVLPLSVIVQEMQQQIVSLVILCGIVFLTGEPITWHWLGLIPAMLLQTMFNVGLCMMVARWTAASRDVTQLVPFVMTDLALPVRRLVQHLRLHRRPRPRGSRLLCTSIP